MSKEELRSRRKSNRQMIELLQKYHNDPREAATHLVEAFMRIPLDNRSDEVLVKIEKEIKKYRRKAQHLLTRHKKLFYERKNEASKLDDTFGKIDDHPSLFGTQEYDDWEEDSEESDTDSVESEDQEDAAGEVGDGDMEMGDVEDLSERLSQLSSIRESTQTKEKKPRGPRGFYKTDKALNDPRVKDKTRQKRLKRIKKAIKDIATKNGISLILLCAMVIKNDTYIHERQLARIAELIIDGGPLLSDISIQEAIYLREECLLTQTTYSRLRQRLKAHGIDLPAEKRYRDAARSMRPTLHNYQEIPDEGPIGVIAHLKPSLEQTFKAILEVVEKNKPDFKKQVSDSGIPKNITAKVKYGLDGSGSHREIGKSKETNVISGKIPITFTMELSFHHTTFPIRYVWCQHNK